MIQVIAKLTLGFLGLSCVAFFYNKSFTIEAINEICINPRYYPKHYCTVPRWIKKHFKVKQRMIPKFLCFEFYISTFYLILGLINSVLSIVLCIKDRIDVIYTLYIIYGCVILIEQAHFIIMSLIYKYNTKETKKQDNQ